MRMEESPVRIFCKSRLIPSDIEVRFTIFLEGYLKKYISTLDDERSALAHLMRNMGSEDVFSYWLKFIKKMNRELPRVYLGN